MLSKQWFVRMKPLAEEALTVVEDGRVKFIPKHWENTYFHWLRNVRDWPISRQLWWGHRIPVWYCQDCAEIVVAADGTPQTCPKCGSGNLEQDPDVLDTWFSSALWPFSTLGWPDKTKDLEFYYPTNTLLTAHEIIFFWVARMIMMGLKFAGDIPFSDVYIHPVVMDERGRKMSKSLGNGVDPIDVIEQYGADSMRLTLCAYAVAGRNISFSLKRLEGYRNFINKIWNAARLVMMNTDDLCGTAECGTAAPGCEGLDLNESALETEDRWILSAYERLVQETNRNLEGYAFDQYIDRIYHFTWGKYCDWYLELVKGRLYSATKDSPSRRNAQRILVKILEGVLRILHPVIPFVTEEIWQKLREQFGTQSLPSFAAESLMVAPWPAAEQAQWVNPELEAQMELMQECIVAARQIRGEHNISPGEKTDLIIACANEERLSMLRAHSHYFTSLISLESITFVPQSQQQGFAGLGVVADIQLVMPLSEEKVAEERKRLQRALENASQAVERSKKKLDNADYVQRAPENVVAAEREKLQIAQTEMMQVQEKLKGLG